MARAATKKVNGRRTWQPIESVPRETIILLKTVRGHICKGRVPKKAKFIKADKLYDGKRIPAQRLDLRPGVIGAVRAVAWKG